MGLCLHTMSTIKSFRCPAGLKLSPYFTFINSWQAWQDFTQQRSTCAQKAALLTLGPTKILRLVPMFTQVCLCGVPCFKSRSRQKRRLNAQVTILQVMETIKTFFVNSEMSHKIWYWDACLKAALDVVGNTTKRYSDFSNRVVHQYQYENLHLFQDSQGIALALSTNGAQLTMKRQSNTWLLILIVLNLLPEIQYTSRNVIINLATPCPNPPGDIESFLCPLFEEMACASEGLWIWDAVDSSYFTHHAYITMGLGDMLGSAKLNGMAGHSAIFGDHFSHMQGTKSSCSRGAQALYYPMSPPQNNEYNPSWPASYDLSNLPIHTEQDYWQTINKCNEQKLWSKPGFHAYLSVLQAQLLFIQHFFQLIHSTFFMKVAWHLFGTLGQPLVCQHISKMEK